MRNKFPKNEDEINLIFQKEDKSSYEVVLCKCFDCCAYNPKCWSKLTHEDFREAIDNIKNCLSTSCPLYGYATKKKQFKEKVTNISDEERQKRAERMKTIRNKKVETT